MLHQTEIMSFTIRIVDKLSLKKLFPSPIILLESNTILKDSEMYLLRKSFKGLGITFCNGNFGV